ncbi:hypothetical protein WMY93_019792 [Mugilogobius chulae]|uniref:Choline/carnitine acyltransferase domain-containing protein n=1 Tax=Mugilogobius chulae TaxID=88201 RepID=A0AAW0NSI7_9GOBI
MTDEELRESSTKISQQATTLLEANEDFEAAMCDAGADGAQYQADVEKTARECKEKLTEVKDGIQKTLWAKFGEDKLKFALKLAETVCEEVCAMQPCAELEACEFALSNLEAVVKTAKIEHDRWSFWSPPAEQTDFRKRLRELELSLSKLVSRKAAFIQAKIKEDREEAKTPPLVSLQTFQTPAIKLMPTALPKFTGIKRDYYRWRKEWEALQRQGEPTGSTEVKKFQLLDSLDERITRSLHLSSYSTAENIFRILGNRFGNTTSIALEIVEELQSIPPVKGLQPRKIVRLIHAVEKALHDLHDLGDVGAIKNPLITKSIESKLPDSLKKDWLVFAANEVNAMPCGPANQATSKVDQGGYSCRNGQLKARQAAQPGREPNQKGTNLEDKVKQSGRRKTKKVRSLQRQHPYEHLISQVNLENRAIRIGRDAPSINHQLFGPRRWSHLRICSSSENTKSNPLRPQRKMLTRQSRHLQTDIDLDVVCDAVKKLLQNECDSSSIHIQSENDRAPELCDLPEEPRRIEWEVLRRAALAHPCSQRPGGLLLSTTAFVMIFFFQHAPYDAMVLVSFCWYLDEQLRATGGEWKGRDTLRPLPLPEELVFTLDTEALSHISKAKQQYLETVTQPRAVVPRQRDRGAEDRGCSAKQTSCQHHDNKPQDQPMQTDDVPVSPTAPVCKEAKVTLQPVRRAYSEETSIAADHSTTDHTAVPVCFQRDSEESAIINLCKVPLTSDWNPYIVLKTKKIVRPMVNTSSTTVKTGSTIQQNRQVPVKRASCGSSKPVVKLQRLSHEDCKGKAPEAPSAAPVVQLQRLQNDDSGAKSLSEVHDHINQLAAGFGAGNAEFELSSVAVSLKDHKSECKDVSVEVVTVGSESDSESDKEGKQVCVEVVTVDSESDCESLREEEHVVVTMESEFESENADVAMEIENANKIEHVSDGVTFVGSANETECERMIEMMAIDTVSDGENVCLSVKVESPLLLHLTQTLLVQKPGIQGQALREMYQKLDTNVGGQKTTH